jgi:diguanylate cyclase (GGDEF)-like protein/PAS domain S-box-containing protein
MTGYTHEELIGQHTRILKSGRHDRALYESLWKTITAGETWIGSLVNRRKDGSFYDEEQTIAPVFAENGELAYFIAIKQDVTKRCQAEAALALAHSELALRLAEIETLNQRLSEQAIRDPLTNLYNRRHFEEAVRRDAAHAARAGALLTIAVLDVDCFKNVNDTYGHAVGDSVLQALAGILVREVRQSELACRMGGDEFAVVLRDTPLVAAANSADRWRAAFASAPIAAGRGGTVQASVSIGVAPYHASVESLEDAMHRADAALYEAKRLGRNRVVVSAETLDPA